MMIGVCVSS